MGEKIEKIYVMKKLFTPKNILITFALFVGFFVIFSLLDIYSRSLEHFIFVWCVFYPGVIFFFIASVVNVHKHKGKKDSNFYFSLTPLVVIVGFFLYAIISAILIGLCVSEVYCVFNCDFCT